MINRSFIENRYKKEQKSFFFYLRRNIINTLFKKYVKRKNIKILDIACGDGKLTEKIKASGYKLIGCDGSFNALKNVSFPSVLADIEYDLPFKKESIDVVIAGEIIEHIFDTDKFISEINRILKFNGLIFITTPNLVGLESRLAILFGKKPWMIENRIKKNYAGHIRYFTFNNLEKLLNDHGFEIFERTSDYIKIRNLTLIKLVKIFPHFGQHIILVGKKIK